MSLDKLRSLLRVGVIDVHQSVTHGRLPDACRELGLPEPPPASPEMSKSKRIAAAFDSVPDEGLSGVVEKYIIYARLPSRRRNELQELAWADVGPAVSRRARRDVAEAMERADVFISASNFDSLLERFWILDSNEWAEEGPSLRGEIDRHVHRNPNDWSTLELFEQLGALDCTSHRFCLFVEGLLSPEVRPNEASQRDAVQRLNAALNPFRLEIREMGRRDDYPFFAVCATSDAIRGKPKNLIFASSVKPDLRFSDAIDNNIEIVTNADRVLVYDRPFGASGLRWQDLQEWWSSVEGIPNDDTAKKTLYLRLKSSLPSTSPPQVLFFTSFYKAFGLAIPHLPALLPEVWLHWDPRTVRERGADALARFRMDFLMLPSDGSRIVIEVDGKQHYSDETGTANPSRYAAMAAADRELRLAGYEVYRFGAAELADSANALALIKDFFTALFRRHGAPVQPLT